MILRVDVLDKAIGYARCKHTCKEHVILMDPRGEMFSQRKAVDLSTFTHLIIVAGHYEGVDERVSDYLIDEQISIGNYILTGGELPAMVIVDSITRLIPNVLRNPLATKLESFSKESILEHPHYTKPQVWKKRNVPKILLSGDHKKIEQWRQKMSKIQSKEKKTEKQ